MPAHSTPDPDRIAAQADRLARRLVREHARMRSHLPAAHPLVQAETDVGLEAIVYTRHDELGRLIGVDHGDAVALAVPAWRQVYVAAPDGESVIVLDAGEDGTLTPVSRYAHGRLVAAPRPSAPATSDEVIRYQVDRQVAELVEHLPPDAADEVRAAIAAGDVEWTPGGAERTAAGRLEFLVPSQRRAYLLDRDRDGRSFAQVVSLDAVGQTAASTYRDGELVGGVLGAIELEPDPDEE